MKTSFLWICTLIMICLCGCATQDTSALRIGMTKDEVIRVMGKPVTIEADSQFEYLNYNVTISGGLRSMWILSYIVRMEQGKVISFGNGSKRELYHIPIPASIPAYNYNSAR